MNTTPLHIVHVDLADGLSALFDVPLDGRDVFTVFWWRALPLGDLQLTTRQLFLSDALAHLVAQRIAPAVHDRLFGPHGPAPDSATATPNLAALLRPDPLSRLDAYCNVPASPRTVSVVVCTRERPEQLARCLASLAASSVRPHEIIVVDNAPDRPGARDVVQHDPCARYVPEPRAGLSVARNTGIRASTGEIVAFTDDDVVVHPDWVKRLAEAFSRPTIMAVTGLVLPAQLETPAQVAFELRSAGLGRGYQRATYGPSFVYGQRTAPVWRIGAGANMALRREALAALGGFDERLGAGAAGCSEDTELWYRLLAEGWECQYEPAAVVFHHHRSDDAALRGQAHAYARGHVAGLFVQFSRYGHRGNLHRAFVTLPLHYARRAFQETGGALRPGRGTLAAELSGYARGLASLPLARSGGKASRRQFLRRNPFAHPLTQGFFYREKMRAIHRVAPQRAFRRVLEVGGGQSGLTSMLYPHATVVNVDLDVAYAHSPLNRGTRSRFVGADATRLPFDAGSFDAVTFFDVLEHVPDDAAAVAEALRVLRPGGFVLVTSPNDSWRFPFYRPLRPLCPTDEEMMAEWGHVRRGYSVSLLEGLFGTAPVATATFITPVTVLAHDIAFSRLRGRVRHALCAGLAPLTWLGYLLHAPTGPGTETASSWQKTVGPA